MNKTKTKLWKIKSRKIITILAALLMATSTVLAQGCESTGDRADRRDQEKDSERGTRRNNEQEFKLKVILENLEIPWSMAFLSDSEALLTERNGSLSLVNISGRPKKRQIKLIAVNDEGEGGLLGVAVHPNYVNNKQIYVYFTYRQGANVLNRVERYKLDTDNLKLGSRQIIIDDIPGNQNHNGGRIKFGPDNKLYILTGDAQEPQLAQDRASLAGKILRLKDDGAIPEDNPFDGSPVFTYGHRNPQGMAWHPETNDMYATEHGQSANDEVNKIESGKNYGWPDVAGSSDDPAFTGPVLSSGSTTWAPSGADFYKGTGRFSNDLFFAALRGNHIHNVNFSADGRLIDDKELFQGSFGRVRDVVFGPDDSLYLLTSNRDGRGNPVLNDDRLIKVSLPD